MTSEINTEVYDVFKSYNKLMGNTQSDAASRMASAQVTVEAFDMMSETLTVALAHISRMLEEVKAQLAPLPEEVNYLGSEVAAVAIELGKIRKKKYERE